LQGQRGSCGGLAQGNRPTPTLPGDNGKKVTKKKRATSPDKETGKSRERKDTNRHRPHPEVVLRETQYEERTPVTRHGSGKAKSKHGWSASRPRESPGGEDGRNAERKANHKVVESRQGKSHGLQKGKIPPPGNFLTIWKGPSGAGGNSVHFEAKKTEPPKTPPSRLHLRRGGYHKFSSLKKIHEIPTTGLKKIRIH